MEVLYELMSYGIPVNALPVNSKGQLSVMYHHRWIQWRRQIESCSMASNHVRSSVINQHSSSGTLPSDVKSGHSVPTSATTTTSSSSSPIIFLEPDDNDCVLGRGKAIDQHVGNVRFRHFLQQKNILMEFENTPKNARLQMAVAIQQKLCEIFNMRFLKENPNGFGWVIATDDAVRAKILRSLRRSCGSKKLQEQNPRAF